MAARLLAGIALAAALAFSEDVSVDIALAADDTCRAGSEECGLELRQLRRESFLKAAISTEPLNQTGDEIAENDKIRDENATLEGGVVCRRYGMVGRVRRCVAWLQGEATEDDPAGTPTEAEKEGLGGSHGTDSSNQTGEEDIVFNDQLSFDNATGVNATLGWGVVCRRWGFYGRVRRCVAWR
ncbi:unnamed protein product [Polarella glacialis]|uniref:Uncharacterized protein n=1 Tax=Polarella glacialis TaxID=89957 RepID=A0A813ISY9_POLGL|nr:unnamed protein product [Polarella glacialis]